MESFHRDSTASDFTTSIQELSPSSEKSQQTSDSNLSIMMKLPSSRVEKPVDSDRKHLHIRSEKRRRERITDGFASLKAVVPTIREGLDSKAVVLKKSAEYIEALEYEVQTLKSRLLMLEQLYKTGGPNDELASSTDTTFDSIKKSSSNDNKLSPDLKFKHKTTSAAIGPVVFAPPPYPIVPGPYSGYSTSVFPVIPPIVGTPIVPGAQSAPAADSVPQDQSEHSLSSTHSQPPPPPAVTLMQPTVPYYFASDFGSKRPLKESKKDKLESILAKEDTRQVPQNDEEFNKAFVVAVASSTNKLEHSQRSQ